MKRTRILSLTLLSALSLIPTLTVAQVGPGGVGSFANTQLWLKADSLIAIQPLNFVTRWYDLSGHARDFTPIITGQSVPSYTDNVINGYPAVSFTDQGGAGGDFLGCFSSLGISGSDAATVVIVARNTTATDEQNGGLYLGQRNVGGVRAVRSYGLEYLDAVRFNGENQVFSDGHSMGEWNLILYTNPSGARVSDYSGYLNGTLMTGSSASTTVPSLVSNFALIGATQMNGTYNPAGYFNGDIMEIALFSGQLTDAERVVLDNNLGAKYLLNISDDHFAWEMTHSHDVSGIAAYNGTIFTNAWSTPMLSINSPTDLQQNEYLFFGHNRKDATTWINTEVPASGTYRLEREWRVDETGDVGTVTVDIPAASLPDFIPGYTLVGVLTDADGDFSSGATMYRPTLSGGVYSVDLNIADGSYITIISYRPEISFSVPAASGPENSSPVSVEVKLNYANSADVSASYSVTGGTATPGADYVLVPSVVTIPAGSLTGTFTFAVINDAIVEPSETVLIALASPSPGVSLGTQVSHQYTITDEDKVYVSFSSAAGSGSEGNTTGPVSAPQLVISGGITTIPGSVSLAVSNGTASSGDWSQSAAQIAIPAGDYTTPVSIPVPAAALSIVGDLIVENDETVNLTLNTFNVLTAGTILASVYTIINDDSSVLSVSTSTPLIPEGDPGVAGTGIFTFTLTNPVSTSRIASFTLGGTATSGTDYTGVNGSVVIPANTLTFTATVNAVADKIVEGDETIILTLTGVSGTPVVTFSAVPSTITIDDDDIPAILYSPAAVTVNEGSSATIEVWLSNPPAGTVTLNVSTQFAGLLNLSPATLTFNASNYATHQVITLQAIENTSMGNGSDNVIISVNDAASYDPFDPLPDILVPVTIVNNDVASLVVNPGSVTVAENGTATFTVALSAAPASGNVVVDLTSNNTSVATISLAQITFTALNWNVPRTITVTGVNNNTIPDASTTISLAVNNGLSDDSFDGLTATVNVNVTNNDVAGFIVSPLSITLTEGGPSGQFTIVLTAQPASNVVFDLVNALPVNTTHPASVTITPAQWNVPVTVTVSATDDLLDGDRTDVIAVTVNASLSDNPFDALAAQNVNINIQDNDPPVITGCPANIVVSNAPNTCGSVVTWTAPVSTAPMVSDHSPGETFPVGVTTVTYTSTDEDGMTSTCSFTVTVNDTQAPVVVCKNATVLLNASGNGTITAADLLAVAPTDNCSVASVVLSRNTFTCADLGTVTVTVTATDAAGNASNCNATVTVQDPFTASVSAGSDQTICITQTSYLITGSSAVNATVNWTTSGSGSFDNPALLHPVYTRGPTDNTNVTLTVTGAKTSGCPSPLSDSMVLTFAGAPTASAGSDKTLCSGTPTLTLTEASATNGTITWTTSGNGTFSNAASANPVYTFGSSDIGPVTLTVTVTNGTCGTASDAMTVTFAPAPVANAGTGDVLCRTETGFQVTGASHANGTVSWTSSGGGTFSNPASDNPYYTFSAADYASGTVTLTMTVTGAAPCPPATSVVTVTILPWLKVSVPSLSNITCNGLTDGQIHVAGSGGQSPYTYSLDGAPFQSSGDFTSLAAGNYTIEVLDAAGCTNDTTLTVTEPLPFNATSDGSVNVACNGASTGAANVSASGGTTPYSFMWTGPDGFTASTEDITGVKAGTYTVKVTDRYSCATFTFTYDIAEPEAIEITSEDKSDYNGSGVTCSGATDGSLSVTVAGGTPPLSLQWSGPGGFTSAQASLTGLASGTYVLTVTDASGCVLTNNYVLAGPDPIEITASLTPASCPDTRDGSIDLTVTGGTGTLVVGWDDGLTTEDRSQLLPGDYTVTVTDINGCTEEQTVTVSMNGLDCLRIFEIITPNGDGRNDTWQIRNADIYPDAEVFIYDRWGKLVYHSRDLAQEWDGTYNGKLLPNDSYHYIIKPGNGEGTKTGVISIISK